MPFSSSLPKLNHHISSLLGETPDLGNDPWKGLAILAALGGYLADRLLVKPMPEGAMRDPGQNRDRPAEETVAAIIRNIERASRDIRALAELQSWALKTYLPRTLPPAGKPRLADQGKKHLARRYRRLFRDADNGTPGSVCVLRGLSFGARTLGTMGWLPAHLGLSIALACEAAANGGNAKLRELRPSLGLAPVILH